MPHMGHFKRALFGYSRTDVDAALADREERIANLQEKAADALERWRMAAEGSPGPSVRPPTSRGWLSSASGRSGRLGKS